MAEADLHLKLDRILAGQDDQKRVMAEHELVLSMLVQGVRETLGEAVAYQARTP